MVAAFFILLFWLLVGHALGDYPIQGDFLAQGKNRNTAIGQHIWPWCLSAHCFIHAGFVAFITGSIWLGVAEGICHAITDWIKCENKISFNTDQFTHIACKIVWAVIVVYWMHA